VENERQREFAVKMMKCDANLEEGNGAFQERFSEEVERTARIRLRGVVRVLGFNGKGEVSGRPMVVMPYYKNGTLESAVERGVREWNATKKSIAVFGIAVILKNVHGKGMAHRSIRPDNIYLDNNWEPVLSNFGLSRILQKGLRNEEINALFFTAPEEFEENNEGHRRCSDVYSYGVLLYSLFREVMDEWVMEDGSPAGSGISSLRF
jgi:serine/threonine protein kinase